MVDTLPNLAVITRPSKNADMIRITESSGLPTFGLNWDYGP
jgi:hypothetical protein